MTAGWSLVDDWFPGLIPHNVSVADTAWIISSHVFVHCHSLRADAVLIGPSSGVYEGCSFAIGPDGSIEIGAFVSLVQAIVSTDSRIVIGDHALIGYGSAIVDSPIAVPPEEYERVRRPAGHPIVIGDNVWIGARCVILGGASIGDDAVVGAGSVVDGDVPAGSVAVGNPCRVVGSVY